MLTFSPPAIEDPDLQKIQDAIGSKVSPVSVKNCPEDTIENNCFPAVLHQVKHNGGQMICGWAIWKAPVMIQAECHAVWETPEGEWKDLNHRAQGFREIIFIRDDSIQYEGKQIPSKRINLTSNKLVDDYIKSWEAFFLLQNKEERANHTDLSYLPKSEIEKIEDMIGIKRIYEILISAGADENVSCPCDRIKKFKDCHGPEYLNMIRTVLEE